MARSPHRKTGSEAPKFEIEFYEDENGREPALAFMQALSAPKRRAIGVALNEVLAHLGVDIVATDYGKNLGGGLFEFRLDQNAEEVLRKVGKSAKTERAETKILLRVFFHAHGQKLILLLSGYDKAERPSKRHQNSEIELARTRLRDWKQRQKAK